MEDKNTKYLIIIVVLAVIFGVFFIAGGRNEEASVEEGVVSEVTVPAQNRPAGGGNNEIPPADNLTVSYTSAGFNPFLIEVNAGDTVRFVNNTEQTMWVTSHAHPTADQHYPEFGMQKSVGPGGVYEFQFTLVGSWGYKNLNNEKHLGAVVVFPQDLQ